MPISIKDAVKIAHNTAASRGLVPLLFCWESQDGWDFEFGSRDGHFCLRPMPGGGFFRVTREGNAAMNNLRSSSIPPEIYPDAHRISIKGYLEELGEHYISLKEAVKIAYEEAAPLINDEFSIKPVIMLPECWENEEGLWNFYVVSSSRYLSIDVSYYGKIDKGRSLWWDLPLPDYDYEWRKIDISKYIEELEHAA